jgi:hypothetical protein
MQGPSGSHRLTMRQHQYTKGVDIRPLFFASMTCRYRQTGCRGMILLRRATMMAFDDKK